MYLAIKPIETFAFQELFRTCLLSSSIDDHQREYRIPQ